MKRAFFVDLDDTLFQTLRKNGQASILAAIDKEGRPLSFQSDAQAAFFDWIRKDAVLIPVTGRNVSALRRVVLPLGAAAGNDNAGGYAICSYGGVIIGPDGEPEPQWHARIKDQSKAISGEMKHLEQILADMARSLSVDCRFTIVADAGLPLYLSIKHNQSDGEEMKRLAQAIIKPDGWLVHLNDSNLALLPPFLGKEKAVSFFLETILAPKTLTIGVGDSLTDLGFMGLMDFAIQPTSSQIFRTVMDQLSPQAAWGAP